MYTRIRDNLTADSAFPRIAPFALFICFVGLDEGLRFLAGRDLLHVPAHCFLYLYPVKVLSVGLLLCSLRSCYPEIVWADLKSPVRTVMSVLVGSVVFALWISMDWDWATIGQPAGYNPTAGPKGTLIAFRLAGASLLVPIMEELFWRSWLVRYLVSQNFSKVQIGCFTWPSFIGSAVLFGLEHNLVLAGIMAGFFYNLLLLRFKSIAQCILAHAVTNLLLGMYVLLTARWQFW